MKLMSDRLPKQKSIAAGMIPLEGGDNWNLTMTYIPRGEEKQHGEGFALWFSQKEVFSSLFDYVSGEQNNDHVMGYGVIEVSNRVTSLAMSWEQLSTGLEASLTLITS